MACLYHYLHMAQGNNGTTGITPMSEFIESELARLENKRFEQEYHRPTAPVDEFNALFRSALEEVWSSS